jgi:hypothetical protein
VRGVEQVQCREMAKQKCEARGGRGRAVECERSQRGSNRTQAKSTRQGAAKQTNRWRKCVRCRVGTMWRNGEMEVQSARRSNEVQRHE